MINKAEIKKIVTRELGDYLTPLGYSRVKAGFDMVAAFEKNDGSYFYGFDCHANKYNEYQLNYGFSFGIDRIVQILKEIDAHVPLDRSKYTIKPSITGISPGLMLDPYAPGRGYKYFDTESGLLSVIEEIKSFYKETFAPFCEKYSRFEELDKLVNSPGDFWTDSNGKTIPIAFFHVTRLVIARLANNPDFDMVVEKNFQALEELWKRGGGIYDRNDQSKPEIFAAEYLRDFKI